MLPREPYYVLEKRALTIERKIRPSRKKDVRDRGIGEGGTIPRRTQKAKLRTQHEKEG